MTFEEALKMATERWAPAGATPEEIKDAAFDALLAEEIKDAALKVLGEECAEEYERVYGDD